MAQKKKTWKDDPLLKAALAKAEFDDDWAYRVHVRHEELIIVIGKSNSGELFGEYDPSAEPNSRWIQRNEDGEIVRTGRVAGERSFPYSAIKSDLRHGPSLTCIGNDEHQSTYHGKDGYCALTLVIDKSHALGPFVSELRMVEGPKEAVYRFFSDCDRGTVLAASIEYRMRTAIGTMVLGEDRQSIRFDDYRYTGPAVDEPEPPKPPMQWQDSDLNDAMAKLRCFDHDRWKYRGRMRGWNATSGDLFADVTFRFDPSIINDEDDQPDPLQDVIDAMGDSDEILPWEEGNLWDYGTIEWTVGQDTRKMRCGSGYAAYRYGPYSDPASPNVERSGTIILRTVGPHAPHLLSLKQFEKRGSMLSMKSSKFSADAESGDPLLRRTFVFDDFGEPDFTTYRLTEAWEYARIDDIEPE